MANTCSVNGCTSPVEAIFELPHDGLRLARAVCAFHNTALMEGEPWALRDGVGELLMGDDLALDIVDWSAERTIGNEVVTLKLGRDGIETTRVSFRVDPATIRRLCHWTADGNHPEDFAQKP